MNLLLVVEIDDHHVTVLNGDTFEPIHRFKTRFALHCGPKYSPGGRFVYFASRDGWITTYDIYNLKVVAEVHAGINTRNPYAWVDVFFGPNKDAVHVIDKSTLEIVKTLPHHRVNRRPR